MRNFNWMVKLTNKKLGMLVEEAKMDFADEPVELEAEIKRLSMMDMKAIEAEFKGLGLALPSNWNSGSA